MTSGIPTVKRAAENARQDAISAVLAKTRRQDTKQRIQAINKICKGLSGRHRRITVANVVRDMKIHFQQLALSESTIRNNTSSGKGYREVISAWANYEVAIGAPRDYEVPQVGAEDISDEGLTKIKPELLRLQVQAMRAALRNCRRQLQMLQAVTPNKLVYHGDESAWSNHSATRNVGDYGLVESERDALLAMLDVLELATHGLSWNEVGQLQGSNGECYSRPGLRQAIERAVGVRGPGTK